MKTIERIDERIKKVNQLIKRYSKIELRKDELKELRKALLEARKRIVEKYIENGYGIDLTSISVIELSRKKSRYLRTKDGAYYKELNLIVAWNSTLKKGYGIFTRYTQIRAKDIEKFKQLGLNQLYTDNRHKGCLTLNKKYTQEIERQFSRVKRRVYQVIKPLQYWKNNKLITDMAPNTLIEIYRREFKAIGIEIIGEPMTR